ncbi:MAG: hypothetical protein ACOCV8_04280 [Spirochaetota bacterium]
MTKINIVLLIIGLAVLGFSLFQLDVYNGNIVLLNDKAETDTGLEVPYIYIEDTDTQPVSTAILLHGCMGNKIQMKNIGIALAHIGVNSYIIDLPGYGGSQLVQDKENLNQLRLLSSFYNWLKFKKDKIVTDIDGNFRLIVLGYSTGASTVVRSQISERQIRTGLERNENFNTKEFELNKKYLINEADTTILLSEFPENFISKEMPKNIFLLADNFSKDNLKSKVKDFLNIQDDFSLYKDDAHKQQVINEENIFKFNYYRSSLTPFSILYRQDVLNDIAKWIVNLYKIDLTDIKYYNQSEVRTLYIIGLILGIILLIFPVSAIISRLWIFDFKKVIEPYRTEKILLILGKNILSLIIATVLTMLFVLFGFIGISLLDFIITIFFYQFVINILFFRNYIFTAAKYDRQRGLKLILALLISIIIYL